ncbi:MAG: DUF2490 domain-containing protein [Flavobacteriales bacterium]|nr:DUF2490 domain-containing protein [Flavobacteriales bacterium]
MKAWQKIFFIIIFLATLSSYADENIVYHNNQQWGQYYLKLKISNKFNLLSDVGFRVKESFKLKSQYIARSALGYKLNENISLGLGFAHLGDYSNNVINKLEYRPYQELLINNQCKRLNFSNRVRIEERIFNSFSSGITNVIRFRYRLMFNYPIFFNKAKGNKIQLNLGDEIFYNAANQFYGNIFNQNRVLAGITYHINKNTTIDFMFNFQDKSLRKENEYQHDTILWLGIKQSFVLYKN